jgi:hypothetical protein
MSVNADDIQSVVPKLKRMSPKMVELHKAAADKKRQVESRAQAGNGGGGVGVAPIVAIAVAAAIVVGVSWLIYRRHSRSTGTKKDDQDQQNR